MVSSNPAGRLWPAPRRHGPLPRIALLVWIAACVAAGAALQNSVHLNHDVGWITHSARWLLEGRRLGSDIIDPNPPLIWFVSLPAAVLVKAGWLGEVTAIRLYVWSLLLLSLGLCGLEQRPPARAGRRAEVYAILAAAAFTLAVLPGASFAQREYLSLLLGLPYALVAGVRLDRGPMPSRIAAIAAGILGGIAFCFKPYLLAVPLCIEIAIAFRYRSIRAAIRPETLALVATGLGYGVALVLFARDYLTEALPIIRATYWAYDTERAGVLWARYRVIVAPAVYASAFLVGARRLPGTALGLYAALVGFSFSYWIQQKGFVYHAFPVLGTAITLLALATVTALRRVVEAGASIRWPLRAGLAATLLLTVWYLAHGQWVSVRMWQEIHGIGTGSIGAPREELIRRLSTLARARPVRLFAFSTHPYPAFPTVNYLHAEWTGRYPVQFTLPAFVKSADAPDAAMHGAIAAAMRHQRIALAEDFRRFRPDIVLWNRAPARLGLGYRRFDDLHFYLEDPHFAQLWSGYDEVDHVGSVTIFVRRDWR